MEINLNEAISYDYLMNKTDDYNIFKFYIERSDIEFVIGKAILSPLRKENNPSFMIYNTESGYLRFKDFTLGISGGAIDMVMEKFNINYKQALERINNDMFVSNEYEHYSSDSIVKQTIRTKKQNIVIESQIYTTTDYNYWKSYGISFSTLMNYNVLSAKYIWLNDILKYTYSKINPIYVYNFNNNYKIYRPKAPKSQKWRVYGPSENTVEGLYQLTNRTNTLIITKSLKDVMLLSEFDIEAVSMSAEGVIPKENFIDYAKSKYENIIVFLDNDETGIKMSDIISKEYGLKNIRLPIESKCKDLSDFCKRYGKQSAVEIFKKMMDGNNLPNKDTKIPKED